MQMSSHATSSHGRRFCSSPRLSSSVSFEILNLNLRMDVLPDRAFAFSKAVHDKETGQLGILPSSARLIASDSDGRLTCSSTSH
jgi:hypothetical protein